MAEDWWSHNDKECEHVRAPVEDEYVDELTVKLKKDGSIVWDAILHMRS